MAIVTMWESMNFPDSAKYQLKQLVVLMYWWRRRPPIQGFTSIPDASSVHINILINNVHLPLDVAERLT